MANIEESIDVEVPVETAYNQWTQFEEFPSFMEGIEEVRQVDDTHLHWVAEVGGQARGVGCGDHRAAPGSPDRVDCARAARATQASSRSTGSTRRQTRVMVQLDWEPEGVTEKIGAALGMDDRRVQGDLKRFKELIEERGAASGPGAARSRIRPTDADVRAALAGAAAAAAWVAAEPAAQRLFGTLLLGRAPARRAALAAALAPRRHGSSPRQRRRGRGRALPTRRPRLEGGVIAAVQIENAAIWPGMAAVDRLHPDRRSGAWPPAALERAAIFGQEAAVHALFGAVLGGLLRRKAANS